VLAGSGFQAGFQADFSFCEDGCGDRPGCGSNGPYAICREDESRSYPN
jgi:hypothetical protein